MKMLKKSIAVILTVLMAISLMPFTALADDVSFTKVTDASQITAENIGTCTAEDAKAWALANWDVVYSDYYTYSYIVYYTSDGELNLVLVDCGMGEEYFSNNFDEFIYPGVAISNLKEWFGYGETVCICTAAAPAPAAQTHDGITFEPWESTTSLPTSGSYYLTDDVTVSSTTDVSDTLNLCLNGHSVLMTGNAGVFHILSGATMNMYDCNESNSEHYVTLDNWRGTAVSDTGTEQTVTGGSGVVKVSGGLITGGYAGNPGGGAFRVDGTLNMNAGTLLGNFTTVSGGAIWTGGLTTIAGNSRITYNKGTSGNRGGVYVSSGTFNISGAPNLTGNSGCDVVLNGSSTKINFNDFDSNVRLGVVYVTGNPNNIIITSGADFANYEAVQATMRHYESSRNIVWMNGQAKIGAPYTVTWNNYDGTTLETDNGVASGATPVYNGEPPTRADDAVYTYSFAGWSPEVSAITGNATYIATFNATQVNPDNGASITVGETIAENFYLDDDFYCETAYVAFTYNHNSDVSQTANVSTDVVAMASLDDATDGRKKFSVTQAPAQATEPVIINVYANAEDAQAGTNAIDTINYSVYTYCRDIIDNYTGEKAEEMKELAKSTLDYAAAAQTYFNYNTGDMATKDATGDFYNNVAGADLSTVAGVGAAPTCIKRVSVVVKSDLEINLLSNAPLTVEGAGIAATKGTENFAVTSYPNGDYYVLHIAGIEAANMGKVITVETDKGDLVMTANSIIKMLAASGDTNLSTLAKAMYLYGTAASAYFD